MPKPNHEWKVLPHGPLEEIDSGIFAVVGEIPMPLMELPRRMTIIKLRDGGLVIWSAIALDEATMSQVESIGAPRYLVVPSDHHRLDAAAWKARYPELQVVTPAGSREKTAEVVPVDATTVDFGDPGVRFLSVPGTREEEAALVVRRPGGTTLVLNDIVGNIRHSSGFGGWVLRRMGLAGDEAQIPTAVSLLIVKDKADLSAQLVAWADLEQLKRIVVSHGDIIDHEPTQALLDLARSLG
ncbi:MAG: hypothetical protein JWQ73_4102 [Variovorax sp.]|nr:hypothetical protein [Variovorax sp.]